MKNELIHNGQGRVVGVYAMTDDGSKLAVKARYGVALATGSFAMNKALMARFIPTFARSKAIGNPYSDGSGHLMAQNAGARLVDMGPVDKIVPPGPGLLKNRPITGICVNFDGKRFTNENSGYAI